MTNSSNAKEGANTARDRLNALFDPCGIVQNYLPILNIEEGLIMRKDGNYIKIIEIDPKGFLRLTADEKNKTIDNYEAFLANAPKDFQIKIITEKTDSRSILNNFREKINEETDPFVKIAREDNYKLVESMSRDEAETRRYFMCFEYAGNPNTGKKANTIKGIAKDINKQVSYMDSELKDCGNAIILHTDENTFATETLYRLLNKNSSQKETMQQRIQRLEEDLNDYRWYIGDEDLGYVKAPPVSIIAPRGITPHYDYIVVDGHYYSYVVLREDGYRDYVPGGWISYYAKYGCDVDLFFSEMKTEDMENKIEATLARKTSTLGRTVERSNQHQLSNELQDTDWILSKMENEGEKFYYCTIIFTIHADTYDELIESRGTLINRLKHDKFKGEKCGALVEEFFKSTLPLCNLSKSIYDKHRRNMTTEGVSSCYPYDEQRLRDENGMVIGTSTVGRALALYNPFDTHRYQNANIAIFGPPGSGKTYFSLMLARRFRMDGKQVMMVLPLKGHEYMNGVKYMGGEFIEFSGGTGSCINLFDISAAADLDAQLMADMEITRKSNLQQKIDEVLAFFEILINRPEGLSASVSSDLEVAITTLYKKYGITENNESLFDEEGKKKLCPTVGDFYEHLKDFSGLSEIRSILRPFIEGSLKNLNGQTNIDMTNKMIAFDVSNAGKYQSVFFFLAVNLCYGKMRENREEMSALLMDEVWKLMDQKKSAEYVKEVVKIVRGYAGSAIIATQNLGDIYNKKNGPEIIAGLKTKFVLQVDSAEKDIYQKVLELNQKQIDRIGKQKASQLTMVANGELYEITTSTSSLEFATYTTDPNRISEAKQYLKKYYENARKEA